MDWQWYGKRLRRPPVWGTAALVALVAAGAGVGLTQGGGATKARQASAGVAFGAAGTAGRAPGAAPPVLNTEKRALSETVQGSAAAGQAGDAAGAAGAAAPTPPPAGSSPGVVPPGVGQARVVRSAQVQVEVRRGTFQKAFDRVSGLAAANGGFVASSSTSDGDRSAPSTGELDLRVPADHFDATVHAVTGIGHTR